MKIIRIKGIEVDLDKIDNPKLRMVMEERERDFMFRGLFRRHDEHIENRYDVNHTEVPHKEHSEQKYSEERDHTDSKSPSYHAHSEVHMKKHHDYTPIKDAGNHQDYWE